MYTIAFAKMVLWVLMCDDIRQREEGSEMNSEVEKQTAGEQKLPTQKTVRLIILAVAAAVTLRMIVAAVEHNQWREFIVSEVAVVVTSLALWFLLRDTKTK